MKTYNHLTHLASTLTVICSLLISVSSYGQTIIHEENFDDAVSKWSICTTSCGNGPNRSFRWATGGNVETFDNKRTFRMDSEVFDFSGMTDVTFEFAYTSAQASKLVLKISTDGGGSFPVTAWTQPGSIINSLFTIPLTLSSSYLTSNIVFRFEVSKGNTVVVDEIKIIDNTAPTAIDVVYGYDAAGNRNSRSVMTVNFVSDPTEMESLPSIGESLASSDEVFLESLESTLTSSAFSVYPNPTQQYVTIQNLQSMENMQLDLYDALGNRITSRSFSSNTAQFDLTRFSSGIYFISIGSGTQRLVYKVVKE